MKRLQRLRLGICQELLLDVFDLPCNFLKYDEIVVDHRIDEGVSQIACSSLSDTALCRLDSSSEYAEDISSSLLKRDNVIWPQHQAHLFCSDLLFLLIEIEHLQDGKDVAFEIIHLGPLFRVHHVLQDQGVQLEAPADLLDDVHIVDAVDVYPGGGGGLSEWEAFLRGFDFLLVIPRLVIIYDGDLRPLNLFLPDVNQRTRGEAHLLGDLLD